MDLENFLSDKRRRIIKKWRDVVFETYPSDTQRFFRKEKDRFSNPAGHTITEGLEKLYNELLNGMDYDKVYSSLENIIRIRAVQDFKPSQAVAFVLQLKKIIREELEDQALGNGLYNELQVLEDRIDDMALLAFDIYSECRQKIYELRLNEVKNQVSRLLQRANLTVEMPEQ